MAAELLSDLLQITHRTDLSLLVCRWTYQPDAEVLPAAYEKLTEAALASGCLLWLQDIRRRTFNDPHITQWLLTEYFPQMTSRLGGRLVIAYLAGPSLMDTILASPGFLPASSYSDKSFGLSFFSDEGEAIQWLTQQKR